MPTPPYSECFLRGTFTEEGEYVTYTVPSSKRAIVSSVSFISGESQAAGFGPYIYDTTRDCYIWMPALDPWVAAIEVELHWVFYAGDEIVAGNFEGLSWYNVNGYLLSDPGA